MSIKKNLVTFYKIVSRFLNSNTSSQKGLAGNTQSDEKELQLRILYPARL